MGNRTSQPRRFRFRPPWTVLLWGLAFALGGLITARADTWVLQNGKEYYGDVQSYSFQTKEVTLRKADGKPFRFPAAELAFGAKTKLILTPEFLRAFRDYRPPFLPTVMLLLTTLLVLFVPAFMGLWSSAHVLGTDATAAQHFQGYLKVLALAILLGTGWLIVSIVLDPGIPVVPDTSADLVLALTTTTFAVLCASLLVSLHYGRSFWKGMAITLLAGVFTGILLTAGGLAVLFLTTRSGLESVVNRFLFEPFGWF